MCNFVAQDLTTNRNVDLSQLFSTCFHRYVVYMASAYAKCASLKVCTAGSKQDKR